MTSFIELWSGESLVENALLQSFFYREVATISTVPDFDDWLLWLMQTTPITSYDYLIRVMLNNSEQTILGKRFGQLLKALTEGGDNSILVSLQRSLATALLANRVQEGFVHWHVSCHLFSIISASFNCGIIYSVT
jgi:hypothetical protein